MSVFSWLFVIFILCAFCILFAAWWDSPLPRRKTAWQMGSLFLSTLAAAALYAVYHMWRYGVVS